MFVKNISFFTIYGIKRIIDRNDEVEMRPRTHKYITTLDLEAFSHIQDYLINPQEDEDELGNTKVHKMVFTETDINTWTVQLSEHPHHLFMLNKEGQTPLDITI